MEIDSYLEVKFPYETTLREGVNIRLIGVIGNQVIGASYYVSGEGDDRTESFGQSLNWDSEGNYSTGQWNHMNLMPLPSRQRAVIKGLQEQAAIIVDRLDAHPDASEVWRASDKHALAKLQLAIEKLVKQLPTEPE